ncbi:MAG: ribosylpyrimidine nucleosidase [Oscillospiraceae bacterium]|nr:ribosylpyrimidine nucleosidase [Oscillospiraceae bacterium]
MEKRKIILDCDPGHDDAIAIMMAANNPKLDLLGITVVAGNSPLDKAVVNALHVCHALGVPEIPVYAGLSRPLIRETLRDAGVHGKSGLDGPVFEPHGLEIQDKHAVLYLIDTLMESAGDITLVPTGPLTNIAMAMRMEPKIIPKIAEIVLMGGAYALGNRTPAAEFNILSDPEAAHVVFTSGVPIVMMGLDLTNQTVCTEDIIERMEAIGSKASKLFGDIMRFVLKTQFEVYGLAGGPLHDVTCVAYLTDPACFTVKSMYTAIDLKSDLCYGRTVCDVSDVLKQPHNSKVGMGIDLERFWDLMEACIRRYS